MINLSNRERKIALTLIVFMFVFIGYQFVYLPSIAKEDQLILKSEAVRNNIKEINSRIQSNNFLQENNSALIKKFQQQGSDEQVMSELLVEVEKLSQRLGMRIANLKPNRTKNHDAYNSFSLSLNVDGSLTEIMQFISELEGEDHLLIIDEFQLTKKSPSIEDLNCQLIISRNLFMD